jgi:uncharacterized protein YbaR (Trm112 family)
MDKHLAALPFERDLFDLLQCPEAHVPLKFVEGRLVSTDGATRRAYPIDGGIPVMLLDHSEVLDQGEWRRLMAMDGPVGSGVAAVQERHAQRPG